MAHRTAPSAVGILLVLQHPRRGRHPWRRRHRRQPSANVNINPEREVGLTASAEGRHLAPAPTPLRWLRAARSRVAPCSLPCSPSPPRAAPAGGLPANPFTCGLRQPAPGRRFAVPQASCGTARAAPTPTGKTTNGSGRRRCYDVAVAGGKVTAGR
ncbi:hypothetical protein [Lonsdalea quercina]|uniref:hypothetical protein n=1 Tax=Lonsdalea quercina TaxID=71657 RepID=UPI003976E44E